MKFLINNQLPHDLATLPENPSHDAVYLLDIDLARVDDLAIWADAAQNGSLTSKPVGKELSSRRASADAWDSSSYM